MPNGVLQPFKPGRLRSTKGEWVTQRVAGGMPPELAERAWANMAASDIYENDIYHVTVDRNAPHSFKSAEIWMLSIRRHDNDAVRDWRDLQAIKNAILGKDVEAVELYPADERLCDASNRTTLFCFMKLGTTAHPRFPVGYEMRIVEDEPLVSSDGQRPHAKGTQPS